MDKDLKIRSLEYMTRIRRFEEKTIQLYQENRIWGHLHPYIGQEAVAAGTCLALEKTDYILSTHRGHGHCIAKGGDMNRMMAELLGKETGSCRGRGGSMHIADIDCGILGANGIVGGGIPISVGVGLSCKMEGRKRSAVCFFGEGAVNNGVFHESLNMAAIFRLPVIFICENNLYAVSTSVSDSSAGSSIWNKACAYDIPGIEADGMDVEDIYGKVSDAVSRARSDKGPTLMEARTYRFYGHHLQDAQAYRDKKEAETYRNTMDPVKNYRQKLLKDEIIDEASLKKMEENLKKEVEDALRFAEESPLPDLEEYLESIKDL